MIDCYGRRGIFRPVATIASDLLRTQAVRKVGFTVSTVGMLLMRQCADHVKKLSLGLGGNAAFIVFDDADLDIGVTRFPKGTSQ